MLFPKQQQLINIVQVLFVEYPVHPLDLNHIIMYHHKLILKLLHLEQVLQAARYDGTSSIFLSGHDKHSLEAKDHWNVHQKTVALVGAFASDLPLYFVLECG